MLSSASVPVTKNTITEICNSHTFHIDQGVIEELANCVCVSNPVAKVFGKCGPLATSYKRKQYYKLNFRFVEPVEYILSVDQSKVISVNPFIAIIAGNIESQ